jgi:N6-adenosine-specific RNA methylase IME4
MDLFDQFDEQFSTILVNSPWTGPPRHRVPSIADLRELPVAGLAAKNCDIYFRTSNQRLPDSLSLLKDWGFVYRGSVLLVALDAKGEPKTQLPGAYFADASEIIIVGDNSTARRAKRVDFNWRIRAQGTLTRAIPADIYRLIESRSNGAYLEMFAVSAQSGWRQWKYRAPIKRPSRSRNKAMRPGRRP